MRAYRTHVPTRVHRRFAVFAIAGFVMFSASFAIATVIRSGDDVSAADSIIVQNAEADHASALDERLHLHLKRLR